MRDLPTPAERERLDLLAEECAEVIQAITKINRHGWSSVNPTLPPEQQVSNISHLEHEIGHLHVALHLLTESEDTNGDNIHQSYRRKIETIPKWLHHSHEGLKHRDDR